MCRRAAMDALHSGRLAQAFELAPLSDPWMRDALAPYAYAVTLRHANSPAELSAGAPELALLGGVLEATAPQTDAASPASSSDATARCWEGAAAYVSLCRACARLEDFRRSRRDDSKFDALGVGGLRPLQGEPRLLVVALVLCQRASTAFRAFIHLGCVMQNTMLRARPQLGRVGQRQRDLFAEKMLWCFGVLCINLPEVGQLRSQ